MGELKFSQDLNELLRKQMILEHNNVDALKKTAEKIKNAVVKHLLYGIALDSSKHADIFKAIVELLNVATAMSEDERENLNVDIKKHIESEEFMIRRAEELFKKTEHSGVKFLLQYILTDEKKHHQMLKDILERIVSKETIAEGACLSFEMVPTIARCQGCDRLFELKEFDWACPDCGGNSMEIVGGKELFVESIEVE